MAVCFFLTDQQWIWMILTHFDIFLWATAKAIALNLAVGVNNGGRIKFDLLP
ncbi:hypothetical protein IQ225_11690 [Synechocystis salina LEGE 06155]|nr:hypothetical protein [Synechocystis salina LEGE 06155]